jgi:hypothetical protein
MVISAEGVIDILDFCAALDPVAREMVKSLSQHLETFQGSHLNVYANDITNRACITRLDTVESLFGVSYEDSPLAQGSQKLFLKLCEPFRQTDTSSPPTTHGIDNPYLAIAPAPELAVSNDGLSKIPDYHDSNTSQVPEFVQQEDRLFLGSNEPHWWLAERSSQGYAFDAQILAPL